MKKKEFCGADASATLNRDDFGVDFGKQMGFKMGVTLRIQIEATAT
jgi:polyisoprenoid-binding protein YceI